MPARIRLHEGKRAGLSFVDNGHLDASGRGQASSLTFSTLTCTIQVEHRSVTECAKVSEECAGLRYTFYRCKHGQIDPRTRIKGNKGY